MEKKLPKMNIFLLEDDCTRAELIEELIQHDIEQRGEINVVVYHARSLDEAKIHLDIVKHWDLLLLDFMLDGTINTTNNGKGVAKYIVKNNIRYSKAIIHSINGIGAIDMRGILSTAFPYEDSRGRVVIRSIADMGFWRREIYGFVIEWKKTLIPRIISLEGK